MGVGADKLQTASAKSTTTLRNIEKANQYKTKGVSVVSQ